MNRLAAAVVMLPLMLWLGGLGGCALSRADQLARQSDRVEAHLVKERDRVMANSDADSRRRLDYLSGLRTQLTVADAARKLAPRLLQDPAQVDSAYDILEEVYSTIDWNIPLSPTDSSRRAMPDLFGAGGLDFSRLQPKPR